MEQPFEIIRTFVGKIEYNFPNPLESLFNYDDNLIEQGTDIDVKVWSANEPMFYVVDMHLDATEGFSGEEDFRVKLVYSALVKVNDEDMDDEEAVKLLGAEVPKILYEPARELLKCLTEASGFPPIILDDYDFDEKLLDMDKDSEQADVTEPDLGYGWILHDIKSTEEGASFLQTLVRVCGETCLEYKKSPLYKGFYRFMAPIEYKHPEFAECDKNFWDLLFQLVFGESEYVNVLDGDDGLPEIEFSFSQYRNYRLTDLTLEEIKELTSELATTAFTSTMVSLYGLDLNLEYGETLPDNKPLLEAEIHKLYNYDSIMDEEDKTFTERVCARMKEYADLTFEYRLLNE